MIPAYAFPGFQRRIGLRLPFGDFVAPENTGRRYSRGQSLVVMLLSAWYILADAATSLFTLLLTYNIKGLEMETARVYLVFY